MLYLVGVERIRFTAEAMALADEHGLKVLGGCNGTDQRLIRCLNGRMVAEGGASS